MNKFHKSLLIGATVISLGAASFAAQADKAADGGASAQNVAGAETRHDGKSVELMKEHMAKRQAALHDQLKLNANQETAWKTYTASMTPPDMGKRPDRAEWAKLSAPERMERKLAMMKQAEARMTTRLAALKTFYATLTPEQQKVFNDNVGKGRAHHRRHHGG